MKAQAVGDRPVEAMLRVRSRALVTRWTALGATLPARLRAVPVEPVPDGWWRAAPVCVTPAPAADAPSPPRNPAGTGRGTATRTAAHEIAPVAVRATAFRDKPPVIETGQSLGVERIRSTVAQRIGDDGERLAAMRLEAQGWRIVARNLRLSRTEIDLLAIDPAAPACLVVVEVRRRTRRAFGLPEETVDVRKRASLRRAAGELAVRRVLPDGRRLPDLPVRIDLIAIDRSPDGRPSLRHHRGIEV